jgi:indole-3-glycerol phosphate synthase
LVLEFECNFNGFSTWKHRGITCSCWILHFLFGNSSKDLECIIESSFKITNSYNGTFKRFSPFSKFKCKGGALGEVCTAVLSEDDRFKGSIDFISYGKPRVGNPIFVKR